MPFVISICFLIFKKLIFKLLFNLGIISVFGHFPYFPDIQSRFLNIDCIGYWLEDESFHYFIWSTLQEQSHMYSPHKLIG